MDLSGAGLATGLRLHAFELRRLEKSFSDGGGIAIDHLDIPSGRVVAVMGLSGTGKSTLLNVLGRLIPVDSRSNEQQVRLYLVRDGRRQSFDLASSDAGRRFDELGYVFQSPHLLRNASCLLNVGIAFRSRGGSADLANLLDLAETVALDRELLVKRARQISGGQKQRTAIGRGIARDPQVLLVDEPTANLDPENGLKIMGTICRWQRARPSERTVIWVTHNILEASVFADELVLLEPGDRAASTMVEPPGRLIHWRDTWPDRAAFGASFGPVGEPATVRPWPMPNPKDPRVLAELLLRTDTVGLPRSETAQALDWVRSTFVTGAQPRSASTAAAITAVIADTAGTIAVSGALKAVTEQPEPNTPPAPTRRNASQPDQLSRMVRKIGFSELLSASRADRWPRPYGISRLIGTALGKRGAWESSTRESISGWWFAGVATVGFALLIAAALVPDGLPAAVPTGGLALVLLGSSRLAWRTVSNAVWALAAFASWFQVMMFMAIAGFLFALVLAGDAVRGSFDASLRTLELSHVVVAFRQKGAVFDQTRIEEHNRELRQQIEPALAALDDTWQRRWLHEPIAHALARLASTSTLIRQRLWRQDSDTSAQPEVRKPSPQDLAFGRWTQQGASVRWPTTRVLTGHDTFDVDSLCAPAEARSRTFTNASILYARSDEPALSQMRQLQADAAGQLQPVAKTSTEPARWLDQDDNEHSGVIVSRALLNRLDEVERKADPSNNTAPGLGTHLCLYDKVHGAVDTDGRQLVSQQIVRIAAIVDRLPKEDLIDTLHILAPYDVFDRYRVSRNRPLAQFDSEAIYFADPRLVSVYEAFFRRLTETGTVLPDAFERIQKGLDTSSALTGFVDRIILGVVLFSAALVFLLTYGFIRQNEKSLCVMRAFGVRLYHIIGLTLLQVLVVWTIAVGLTIALGSMWIAESLKVALVDRMSLAPNALAKTGSTWSEWIILMTFAVIVAGTAASTTWWLTTRNVGDRLKELD